MMSMSIIKGRSYVRTFRVGKQIRRRVVTVMGWVPGVGVHVRDEEDLLEYSLPKSLFLKQCMLVIKDTRKVSRGYSYTYQGNLAYIVEGIDDSHWKRISSEHAEFNTNTHTGHVIVGRSIQVQHNGKLIKVMSWDLTEISGEETYRLQYDEDMANGGLFDDDDSRFRELYGNEDTRGIPPMESGYDIHYADSGR
jgi:hypothetical protein